MNTLALIAACAFGLAVGGVVGWVLGRAGKGSPLGVVLAFALPFVAGVAGVWWGIARAERGAAVLAVCFMMGALTTAKYSSGVVTMTAPSSPASEEDRADA